jgi:2-polyprenyl-6-methoxyphenol hydroxylase-like FAD-dependent oxidoreductase
MKLDGKLLVAGGGIGGLTLARAAAQAGFECEVLEREHEIRPAGAGILVQTGAMLALRRLGLDEQVAAAGAEVRVGFGKTDRGAVLQRSAMDFLAKEFGVPTVAIHRARLHAVLLDAAKHAGARVHTGRKVARFAATPGEVRVELEDGSSTAGAVLVGADGLHSVVRREVLGDTPLRYAGYTSYRGIAEDAALVAEHEVTEMWGRGSRFGFARISDSEVYWFAVLNAPEGERDDAPLATVCARFSGFAEPVPALLAATAGERVLKTDIHDRVPVAGWTRGRATLLGDAAHPTTPNLGQGGCMAIEDALTLVDCLERAGALAEALAGYEARRFEPTRRIVEASFRFGKVAQLENRAAIWVRNLLARATPASTVEKQLRKNVLASGFGGAPSTPAR